MQNENRKIKIVYAVYPNTTGFGFVCLENARRLIDFGVVRISPISNRKVLEKIKHSLLYLRPSIVIVQDPEGTSSRTGSRVSRLIKKIVEYADSQNLKVFQYSRDQIRDVFEQFGCRTKYEIARLLLTEFKDLEGRTPKQRSLWMSEDRNMAIFDALSLALTWFYLNE